MTDLEREAREAAKAHRADTERHYYTDNERCTKQVSFELGYLAAAAPRELELRRLRLLAEEQLTTLRKLKAEMLSDTRDAEIERLRARVEELKGMVPRWVPVAQKIALDIQGWLPLDDQKCGDDERLWLMVPPIPLPETKT